MVHLVGGLAEEYYWRWLMAARDLCWRDFSLCVPGAGRLGMTGLLFSQQLENYFGA
jgi:hypothetical protein